MLYPQIGDRLDLLCPRARPPGPHSSPNYEFYKLYLVGGAQGRRCEAPPAPNLLLTCDRPDLDLRFTIKFQEYSPNLWGHEFRSHHDYYIIGTAGQRAGSGGGAPETEGRGGAQRDPRFLPIPPPHPRGAVWVREWGQTRGWTLGCQPLPLALLSQPLRTGPGKAWRVCREACALPEA